MTIVKTARNSFRRAADIIFRPRGNISATDVQRAIEELDTEKQPLDSDLTAIAALAVTKGNVMAANGTAWTAEGLGSNTFVLTADSAQANGVKWAAAAAGGSGNTLTVSATNDEGGALALGDVVTVDDADEWDGGNTRPKVHKADANVAAEMPALGIVSIGGADAAEVTVVSYGILSGLDTSGAAAVRDLIYVDFATPGGWTSTRPEAATEDVQQIGMVLVKDASAGVIFVQGAQRTNDIPNRQPSDRFRIADATDETKLLATDVSAVASGTTRTATWPSDANGTLVTEEATQTLTNKKLSDSTTTIVDDADNTKQVAFQVSGVTTATTRTITVLDNDFTIGRESFIVAVSDEVTGITTGTAKVTFRMPYAFTLTEVRMISTTAPTGSTIIGDINEDGATVLTTKLTIDATEKTSTTAATPAVIGGAGPDLADDAEMTFDIDQIGSTVAGAGVKFILIGYQT